MSARPRRRLRGAPVLLTAGALFWTVSARTFPPYRTTDAEVAEPGVAEVRLELVKVEREHDENDYFPP